MVGALLARRSRGARGGVVSNAIVIGWPILDETLVTYSLGRPEVEDKSYDRAGREEIGKKKHHPLLGTR